MSDLNDLKRQLEVAQANAAALQKMISDAEQEKKQKDINRILDDIKACGITTHDLFPLLAKQEVAQKPLAKSTETKTSKPRKPGKPAAVKYLNPVTGESWAGRGKLPKWLHHEEGRGRKREEFLVSQP